MKQLAGVLSELHKVVNFSPGFWLCVLVVVVEVVDHNIHTYTVHMGTDEHVLTAVSTLNPSWTLVIFRHCSSLYFTDGDFKRALCL